MIRRFLAWLRRVFPRRPAPVQIEIGLRRVFLRKPAPVVQIEIGHVPTARKNTDPPLNRAARRDALRNGPRSERVDVFGAFGRGLRKWANHRGAQS